LGRPIKNVSGQPIRHANARALHLTPEQHRTLTDMTRLTAAHGGNAFRARLILALASGQSYAIVAAQLKTTAPTISRWKRRFLDHGVAGLKNRNLGKKPRPEIRTRLTAWLRAHPEWPAQKTQSYRAIAQDLSLKTSTVHRILRKEKRPLS